MKNKISKTFVSAMLLSTVSFSSAFASDMCADPIQKICTDTSLQRMTRDNKITKLKSEIALVANQKATPRIEEMKHKIPKFRFIKRAFKKYLIRNQEIMEEAKRRIVDLEKVIKDEGNQKLLKSYMAQAIDESNFDGSTKEKFKETINSIVIGNFGDYIERTNLDESVMALFLQNACGSDGMVPNAFATTINKDRYVLICPGFLITLSEKPTQEEKFNTILHAISHEMGHHIDNSKVGNELYAPYLKCLADNNAKSFNKKKDDVKFCKKKDEEECNLKVATSHAGELIADQWGIKTTAIHAKRMGYSKEQAQNMLVNSWEKLCGTGDEGIHPTGDFRMATLMRGNPEMIDMLSCTDNSKAEIGCTLDGEVRN